MESAACRSLNTSLEAPDDTSQLIGIIKASAPDLSQYEEIYRNLHQHPELPQQERRTASSIVSHLRQLGMQVYERIGGEGVVGILRNGSGQTILLRAELDALPIREETGLPYASTAVMADEFGTPQPVMHACGHDLHMAALLACIATLTNSRKSWHGTVIAVFQSNEEYTGGAQAMIDDGLYDKIRIPSVVLGQHIVPSKSGTVALRSGVALPAADAVDVRIYGDRGPGVNPQNNIDPIEVAVSVVSKMPALAKQLSTKELPVKIGCRSFHAGVPRGDYVAHADFNLDIKSYNAEVRTRALKAVREIIDKKVHNAGIKREATIDARVRAPITYNTPAVIQALQKTFAAYFKGFLTEMEMDSACEDFSILATAKNVPYAYWNVGATDPKKWDDANRLGKLEDLVPVNHSPFFAPDLRDTLKTAYDAMTLAALTFLIPRDR